MTPRPAPAKLTPSDNHHILEKNPRFALPNHLEWSYLGKKIGSGGQGTVYLVHHRDDPNKTPRALKILNSNAPQIALKRFQREIETVHEIEHPNIIEVLDYSPEDEEFKFLVMDYPKCAKTIEEKCLSPSDPNPFHGNVLKCLELFEELMSAIHACESQPVPIYHRDISPKKILILPDDTIRLIDFGLCHTDDDSTITLTGENIGTRSYAPPECEARSKLEPGTHSDIFSATKVLWSIITSQRVFGREETDLDDNSMQVMFPTDEETWHLDQMFRRIIRYNPNDRPQSAKHVILLINLIRYDINNKLPPLESVADRCPSCRRKGIQNTSLLHQLIGGDLDKDYTAYECSTCGFIFARRHETLNRNIRNQYA